MTHVDCVEFKNSDVDDTHVMFTIYFSAPLCLVYPTRMLFVTPGKAPKWTDKINRRLSHIVRYYKALRSGAQEVYV